MKIPFPILRGEMRGFFFFYEKGSCPNKGHLITRLPHVKCSAVPLAGFSRRKVRLEFQIQRRCAQSNRTPDR